MLAPNRARLSEGRSLLETGVSEKEHLRFLGSGNGCRGERRRLLGGKVQKWKGGWRDGCRGALHAVESKRLLSEIIRFLTQYSHFYTAATLFFGKTSARFGI